MSPSYTSVFNVELKAIKNATVCKMNHTSLCNVVKGIFDLRGMINDPGNKHSTTAFSTHRRITPKAGNKKKTPKRRNALYAIDQVLNSWQKKEKC